MGSPCWPASSSSPPPSPCPSTLQLCPEGGTTTETLAGPQTLPSLSTPGQGSSTRSSPSGGSRPDQDPEINLWKHYSIQNARKEELKTGLKSVASLVSPFSKNKET